METVASKQNRVHLDGRYGVVSHIAADFWLYGYAFYRGKLVETGPLSTLVEEHFRKDELASFANELNGSFTLIWSKSDHTIVITDKVRSRPLYYAENGGGYYITDDVKWLQEFVAGAVDQQSVLEFSRSGYVAESRTLLEGVHQTQAAEILVLSGHQLGKSTYSHFLPDYNAPDVRTRQQLHVDIDKTLRSGIGRALEVIRGRQVVVPLSGGYDSRVLALYLKRSGYDNIIAFTFGSKNSKEVAISKAVAGDLGIPWFFVPYTLRMWRQIRNEPEFRDYCQFIHSLVSVPNIQVFPAVRELIRRGVIDEDAVVVPGHTADFVAGGHIVSNLVGSSSIRKVAKTIFRKHYTLTRSSRRDRESIIRSIEASLHDIREFQALNECDGSALYEAWDHRERQSKLIVNSNRYYDYFHLDWVMPFWDNEFVNLWKEIPPDYRRNEKLWINFAVTEMNAFTGVNRDYGHPTRFRTRIEKVWYRATDYFTDNSRLIGVVPFSRWLLHRLKITTKPGGFLGYLSEQLLVELRNRQKTRDYQG